ncbi:MAG TPA: NAD-dependent epimerase/dehydratase family protein, partial [Thermodesulfobacteriota bacterium]|nr:NAD-dependent epimerase/dehydratase family protein [Thermodesulfobacteriota bacterium]
MTTILITGGAGSFGRTLAASLKREGTSLRIFDLPQCNFDFFQDWEDAEIMPGNILDLTALKEAVRGVDLIYHLAAVLPPASEEDR